MIIRTQIGWSTSRGSLREMARSCDIGDDRWIHWIPYATVVSTTVITPFRGPQYRLQDCLLWLRLHAWVERALLIPHDLSSTLTVEEPCGMKRLTISYRTSLIYRIADVSYSFVSHLLSFDFNRSVPPSISQVIHHLSSPAKLAFLSQKLLTPTEKSKPEKRDGERVEEGQRSKIKHYSESKSPSQSTTPQSNTPRSTKRIVIKTPVEC